MTLEQRNVRVFLISGEYPPAQGGVGDYTAHLAKQLAVGGSTVTVATTRSLGCDDEPGNPAVWRHVERWDYRAMLRVRRQAMAWRAGLIHLQYQSAAYGLHPAANLAGLLLRAGRPRPRLVVTFHDLKVPYIFPKAGPLRKAAVTLLAATADGYIVTNAEDAAALRARWPFVRTPHSVIPIGSNIPVVPKASVNSTAARQRLGVVPEEFLLAYFGFLNEGKGVDVLLAAVGGLLRQGRRIRLVMIGGTTGDADSTNLQYAERIRAMAAAAPLGGAVVWTGFVDRTAASAYLSASDACALPFVGGVSFRHGTLVAAIAHGLPIVSTLPPPSHGRSIGEGNGPVPLADRATALLVPPQDAPALTAAIEELMDSPELRAKLAVGAASLAHQFQWPSIAAANIDLYRRILGDTPARRPR